jgi:ribosome production factor 1
MYDSSSYLTSDPAALRAAEARAAEASRALNATSAASDEGSDEEEDGASEEDEEGDEDDKGEDEDMEAGPSTAGPSKPRSILKNAKSAIKSTTEGDDQDMDNGIPQEGAEIDETPAAPAYQPPPRIMITTSPSPCKETYDFCEDLRGIFPGGEFFKRPKGKGFEIGRIGRWAAKRGYGAVLVVNENHKTPSE